VPMISFDASIYHAVSDGLPFSATITSWVLSPK